MKIITYIVLTHLMLNFAFITSCISHSDTSSACPLSSQKIIDSDAIDVDLAEKINSNAYGFIDGINRYGNTFETQGYLHRRLVYSGETIYGGISHLFYCNIDGTNKQVIYDQPIGQVSLYDGWIYFSNCEYWSRFFESSCLFRIRPDGSCLELIYDSRDFENGKFMNFYIFNDRIYMDSSFKSIEIEGDRFGIQSMSLVGENIVNICSYPASILAINDEVFYISDNKVYKWGTNGHSFIIDRSDMWRVVIDSEYIYYYSTVDNTFYRTEVENGVPQMIKVGIESNPDYMFVNGDYLFYTFSYQDEIGNIRYKLARTNKDGSGKEEVISDNITRLKHTELSPTIVGDWIFYDPYSKVKLDGSKRLSTSNWLD